MDGVSQALDTTDVASILGDAVAALTTGATVVAVRLGAGTPPVDIRLWFCTARDSRLPGGCRRAG